MLLCDLVSCNRTVRGSLNSQSALADHLPELRPTIPQILVHKVTKNSLPSPLAHPELLVPQTLLRAIGSTGEPSQIDQVHFYKARWQTRAADDRHFHSVSARAEIPLDPRQMLVWPFHISGLGQPWSPNVCPGATWLLLPEIGAVVLSTQCHSNRDSEDQKCTFQSKKGFQPAPSLVSQEFNGGFRAYFLLQNLQAPLGSQNKCREFQRAFEFLSLNHSRSQRCKGQPAEERRIKGWGRSLYLCMCPFQ